MGLTGIEPALPKEQDPKSCASANSATAPSYLCLRNQNRYRIVLIETKHISYRDEPFLERTYCNGEINFFKSSKKKSCKKILTILEIIKIIANCWLLKVNQIYLNRLQKSKIWSCFLFAFLNIPDLTWFSIWNPKIVPIDLLLVKFHKSL